MIHICFKDNGKGMSQEQIDDLNRSLDECKDVTAHMGLHNVHNRLKIVFGSESYVKIVSNAPNPGVSVWLVFGKKIEAF